MGNLRAFSIQLVNLTNKIHFFYYSFQKYPIKITLCEERPLGLILGAVLPKLSSLSIW